MLTIKEFIKKNDVSLLFFQYRIFMVTKEKGITTHYLLLPTINMMKAKQNKKMTSLWIYFLISRKICQIESSKRIRIITYFL